jgi:phage baseplate assembly protein gpV
MADMGEMLAKIVGDAIQPVLRDVHMLKSAFSRMVKEGAVEEISAEEGYRIKLGEGEDGQPYLSGWVPHPEDGKQSTPLKKGQRVALLCPGGDIRQALIIRSGYSDEHPSPNQDMEANVFSDAGYTQTIKAGGMTVNASGQIEITAAGGHLK